MEVDTVQITHFANFLKRVYITCCMNNIVNDIRYNENVFLDDSKFFFERIYNKNEFYDEDKEYETMYSIYTRLSENKCTDSDIHLLYETLKYEIISKMNVFFTTEEDLLDDSDEDEYNDKLREITSYIFSYIKKYIPSLSYIQYLEMCIH